jgi:NCAIR mutase (PurE)-related protein
MNLEQLLNQVKLGELDPTEATKYIEAWMKTNGRTVDLGFANLDIDREKRTGFPEVIFGESKTAEQIIAIFVELRKHTNQVIATRVDSDKAEKVINAIQDLQYHREAKVLIWRDGPPPIIHSGYVAVVCAGTSDLPVAEEAALITEAMGCRIERIYDVGVAGIHRLFKQLPRIREASAIVVVAGMEGALASVVGGLVSKPVIAVPTSFGYGANFQGVSALLSMLNACAPGISVVNIDNGFGAGYMAGLILKSQTTIDGVIE